jgi:hypothetical protein
MVSGGGTDRAASAAPLDRPQMIARFNHIEEQGEVTTPRLEGAHLWPFLRVQAGTHHCQVHVGTRYRAADMPSSRHKVRSLLNGFLQRCTLRASDGPLLFLSGQAGRVRQGRYWVDRFAHPLMEAASALGHETTLLVEGTMPSGGMAPIPGARIVDVTNMQYASNVRHWRRPMAAVQDIPGLPPLLTALADAGMAMPGDLLAHRLRAFRCHLAFCRAVLEKWRPAHVLLWSWYGPDRQAMAHACRERGIPCTDLQHGVQGPAHLAYGRWAHVPPGGWTTIPDRFWCWDQGSVDHIASWAPSDVHRPFLGGSPWLERTVPPTGPRSGPVRVLFSMQPMAAPIPHGFDAVIREMGEGYQWVFRPHPLADADLMPWKGWAGIQDRIRVEDPVQVPIAHSLAAADVHITQFSSVIAEAAMLGVPSIALHREAGAIFGHYLRNGDLRLATLEQLPGMLAALGPRSSSPTHRPPLAQRLARLLGDPSTW